jgi:hypothetical protein
MLISGGKFDTFMERVLAVVNDIAHKSGTESDLTHGRILAASLEDAEPVQTIFGNPIAEL